MVSPSTSAPGSTVADTISPAQVEAFHTQGFLVVEGLFSPEQVQTIRAFFDAIAEKGEPIPDRWHPKVDPAHPQDMLGRYPRVMQPHRFDAMSKGMMLHPRVHAMLEALLGEEPVACQSMFYFKPPGARGQALHQDNFYLDVMPDTCIAAWTAIDAADADNGGLMVVPNTHTLPIQCPSMADPGVSFSTHLVNAPKGFKARPVIMQPGDTLFFNGNVIHGSGPNRSKDRWRRAFICHYMKRSTRSLSRSYHPVLAFDGREIPYEFTGTGGPCGEEVKPGSYDKIE